jgi:acetoin utilization deacetylase AcuC-like enzyme
LKVVFHEDYRKVYAADPAAAAGRLDGIVAALRDTFAFVTPRPASDEDLLLVHHPELVERVKRNTLLYKIAALAAGGAIEAAHLAARGEPAFALIRPPGHHAGPASCWGFCWFNNVAVAVEKLRQTGEIQKALIIDIDLHYGDGTAKIFAATPQVMYHHLGGTWELARVFANHADCDLVAVSAGFDAHVDDWGGMLSTQDYQALGEKIGRFARNTCGGRVFAALEGGYNRDVLGKNVKAFLKGLDAELGS